MTITNTASSVTVMGNGSTETFSYGFEIPDVADGSLPADLYYTNLSGAQGLIAQNLWSITGQGNASGGTFTYPLSGSPIASGTSLLLIRALPIEQQTMLGLQGQFNLSTIEGCLDYLTMVDQDISNGLVRTIQAPFPEEPSFILPDAATRANTFLGFDANGDVTVSSSGGGGGGGAVSSVFGRTGAVVAQANDYSYSQISGTPSPTALPVFTSIAAGVVPASGGGTSNFMRADGSWAAPPGTGGSGSGLYSQVMSATPTASSAGLNTQINFSGTAAHADDATGVSLYDFTSTGASDNMEGFVRNVPSTPYTITALVAVGPTPGTSGNAICGFGYYDGTSKIETVDITPGTGGWVASLDDWSSPTAYFGTPSMLYAAASVLWIKVADNGTNISYAISTNGSRYFTIYSLSKSSSYLGGSGYTKVGLWVNTKSGGNMITLLSWTQS